MLINHEKCICSKSIPFGKADLFSVAQLTEMCKMSWEFMNTIYDYFFLLC